MRAPSLRKLRFIVFGMVLLIVSPRRFGQFALQYEKTIRGLVESSARDHERSACSVRRAAYLSLAAVLTIVALGYLTGNILNSLLGAASPVTVRCFQYSGIGVLLWATLAKGGWNLQTWTGDTLIEHVDQWLFRVLYLIGSLLLVISATWPQAFG